MVSSAEFITAAERYSGVPYSQSNPQSPTRGLDCSGLVQLALSNVGISVPRTTSAQLTAAEIGQSGHVVGTNLSLAQPGDVIHYPGHEEIYLGGNQVFSESTFGTVASVRNRTPEPILGIVRYTDPTSATLTSDITASPQIINPIDPSTWFSGLGLWIQEEAKRAALIVFGAALIIMGLIIMFKDTGIGKASKAATEAALL